MGYTTDFTGRIELDRELSDSEAQAIRDYAEERHTPNVDGAPSYYCQWEPSKDGRGIEWDGGEKFYSSPEWMQLVLDKFITPLGIKANGYIDAHGEDNGDIWRLFVTDNVVTTKRPTLSWD